jgi:hypothetical protein
MNAAMLRDPQTVNHAGLSPHDIHCHQYLDLAIAIPQFVQVCTSAGFHGGHHEEGW